MDGQGAPLSAVTLPGGGQPAMRGRWMWRMQVFKFERQAVTDAAVQAAYVLPAFHE